MTTTATETIVGPDGEALKTSAEVAITTPTRRALDMPAGALSDAAQRSPLDLIETTLRMGASLEQTREVIALARDMEQYDARKKFFAALARFKETCPPIAKNRSAEIVSERKGTEYGYTWADRAEIQRTIGPTLGECGLSVSFEHEQEGAKVTTFCVVRHREGHEQKTPVVLTLGGSPGMSEQQKVASTMENGRRFAIISALGLVAADPLPDETGGGEKITEDQAVVIEDLLKETKVPPSRVLKYFKVDKVADILAIDYPAAVALLEEKKPGAK